jgi:hypothetical protein
MPGVSLTVVIPTSNRAALAIAACRSLLAQQDVAPDVFVSDNSTRDEESAALASFCRAAAHPRLTYLRPETHLAMAAHWDWAIAQTLERSAASHLMVHYDRKITKPGELRRLSEAAATFPDRLITYAVDHVADRPRPATLWQAPWTGGTYSVRASRVIEMTASASIDAMGHVFPILSNCVVPRTVLLTIRHRFGNICDSTGPDSCFTYRFAALHDTYLHCDRTAGIIYASHRSNGLGYLRHGGGDFASFMASWGDRPWLDAAPIPGLNVGQNMLFHEYELVRRHIGSGRFPPIDRAKYLENLHAGLAWIEDEEVRDRLRGVLVEHGLPTPDGREGSSPQEALGVRRPWSVRLTRGLASRARSAWYHVRRRPALMLFLVQYLGLHPEHITGASFATEEEALRFGVLLPRRPLGTHHYLETMQAEAITGARLPGG